MQKHIVTKVKLTPALRSAPAARALLRINATANAAQEETSGRLAICRSSSSVLAIG